jgi:flagellar protein FlbD
VILLTRLGGQVFALNQDLIERADCTPDTVITLVDGSKYVVSESLPRLVDLIRDFRAAVISQAQELEHAGGAPATPLRPAQDEPASAVIPLHRRER